MLHKLKVAWSLWRYTRPIQWSVAASAVCYAVGWYLSTDISTAPFGRSGAAASACALFFGAFNVVEALKESERTALGYFEQRTKAFPLTGQQSQERIAKQLAENTQLAIKVVTFTHAALLIIGTLVWGFGDLIVQNVECG